MSNAFNIVVLISGNGSNLQAIIDQIRTGTLPATITAVISNRDNAYGLTRADKAGIPAIVVEHAQFESREEFDDAVMQTVDQYNPDLIVLAGFMRILSDKFVNHYQGKLINIHPSLLPKYQGLNTHQRAIDAGDRVHGASAHYVTPEIDSGPVILQSSVPIKPDDTADTLKQRVHEAEHKLYPEAIRRIATGLIYMQDNTVYYKNQSVSEDDIQFKT